MLTFVYRSVVFAGFMFLAGCFYVAYARKGEHILLLFPLFLIARMTNMTFQFTPALRSQMDSESVFVLVTTYSFASL